ncbi:carboxypeptidase-like regulatory domain-containing protein [Roseiconus lacunae]|nr:carboxypeptidase-like regulatory domain-containing protein [Roseiconus lacunae]
MIRFYFSLILFTLIHSVSGLADEIVFKSGQTMNATVVKYSNGTVTIQKSDGSEINGPISRVESIRFGDSKASGSDHGDDTPRAVKRDILAAIANYKGQIDQSKRPGAIVAMYLDTEDRGGKTERNRVEYRCYRGGGYSGIRSAPLRQAWTTFEFISSPEREGPRRIQLDPGPPYKTKQIDVNVKSGEVTNLGRIVFEKVQADGTASIFGIVKGADGKAMPNVSVTAGSQRTITDSNGKYQLDGFGLENVSLKASQPGLYGGDGKVSIRDMSRREIEQDLILFRPMRIKFRYVISDKKSTSFEGNNVQEGSFVVTADSVFKQLSEEYFSSPSFREFAKDVGLRFSHYSGRLAIDNFMAPIYYQVADSNIPFESIQGVGNFSSQHGPALEQGETILIRGFRDNSRSGVSDYCVKLLVEEMTPIH